MKWRQYCHLMIVILQSSWRASVLIMSHYDPSYPEGWWIVATCVMSTLYPKPIINSVIQYKQLWIWFLSYTHRYCRCCFLVQACITCSARLASFRCCPRSQVPRPWQIACEFVQEQSREVMWWIIFYRIQFSNEFSTTESELGKFSRHFTLHGLVIKLPLAVIW